MSRGSLLGGEGPKSREQRPSSFKGDGVAMPLELIVHPHSLNRRGKREEEKKKRTALRVFGSQGDVGWRLQKKKGKTKVERFEPHRACRG